MTQDIVLTGATGFVGFHVARRLAALGNRVTCVIRSGSADRLPPGIDQVVEVDDIFVKGAKWWAGTIPVGACVVHCAWTATPGKYLHDPANLDCLKGTLALAQGAITSGTRKFVGIGSCIEYRMGDAPLASSTPIEPTSPYAGAKAAAFLALASTFDHVNLPFAWCRLFHLYGAREHPDRLVTSLHSHLSRGREIALSSGTQIRDFLDVEEGATRIAAVALGSETGPLNICSGIPRSIRDLATEIAESYGRPDLLRFGARPDNPFDPPYVVGLPSEIDCRAFGDQRLRCDHCLR